MKMTPTGEFGLGYRNEATGELDIKWAEYIPHNACPRCGNEIFGKWKESKNEWCIACAWNPEIDD